jgi:threonine/homoserine/homoserine lactone efflux protein
MELHVWLAFAGASFIMGVIPGPGVATIVGIAFSSGRATACAAVAGMAGGNATAMTLSLAGAAAVLASSAWAFMILKWIGALYLIALGVMAIRKSGSDAGPAAAPRPISPRAAFLTTMAVGTFHPKTILFFVAFATHFIDPAGPYLPQAAILVVTFTAIAAATDTLYALAADRASNLVCGEKTRLWARRAGGGVLVAAGVATAAMRR